MPSMSELNCCTIMTYTFGVPPGTAIALSGGCEPEAQFDSEGCLWAFFWESLWCFAIWG